MLNTLTVTMIHLFINIYSMGSLLDIFIQWKLTFSYLLNLLRGGGAQMGEEGFRSSCFLYPLLPPPLAPLTEQGLKEY